MERQINREPLLLPVFNFLRVGFREVQADPCRLFHDLMDRRGNLIYDVVLVNSLLMKMLQTVNRGRNTFSATTKALRSV